MPLEEILNQLSHRLRETPVDPGELVYVVSMRSVLTEIVRRRGEQALDLTVAELLSARDEVKAAIGHYLDEREYIGLGLDAWDVTRT